MPITIPDNASLEQAQFDILKDGRLQVRILLSSDTDSGELALVMSFKTASNFLESFQRAVAAQAGFLQQGG